MGCHTKSTVQFSPLTKWVVSAGTIQQSSSSIFSSSGGHGQQFWHGQGCLLLTLYNKKYIRLQI